MKVDLKNILNMLRTTSNLYFQLSEEEGRLYATLKGKTTKKLLIPLLETIDSAPIKKYCGFGGNVIIDFDMTVLKETMDELSTLTSNKCEYVLFSIKNGRFILTTEGLKNSVLDIDMGTNVDTKQEIQAKYAYSFITDFLPLCSIADNLQITFGSDLPLEMKFTKKNEFIAYCTIAPRCVED
jgi:hypothetical protein